MRSTTTAAPGTTTSSTSTRRLTAAALAAAFASDRWVVERLCGILAVAAARRPRP
ncbi:hypothetical protein [Cellulosimicrobium cellulans]|uniref:hypothetical protein n=1 Tax=Cellulosimicrobium cellulans TaxID=1710 RepID=UPI002405E3F7|nr:hypothetical protein [Cellulosimicrobium cellulans]MDF9878034.1 hypothetical protein [Cellulosimicrobium cellulans]